MTEKDVEMFRALNQSEIGRQLLDYLERMKIEVFNPKVINKDNVDAKKEIVAFIDENLIERINLINQQRNPLKDEYL